MKANLWGLVVNGILTPKYFAKVEQGLRAKDAQKGLAVVKRILASTDEEFGSRRFILDQILEFGLSHQPWDHWARWTDHMNSSGLGLLQIPTEFADFLLFLSKQGIETSLEIGVYAGATSYITAAVLQRANPNAVYYMLDAFDQVVEYDMFASVLNLKRVIPHTTADIVGQEFDYVLVDADHSYTGAKTDYLNVGRYARKVVAFHDVHGHEYDHQDGGIVRAWSEIRAANADKHTIIEFAHNPMRWMGLGVIVKGDAQGFG